MRRLTLARTFAAAALAATAATTCAQLLPRAPVGATIGEIGRIERGVVDEIGDPIGRAAAGVGSLARDRLDRLRAIVRAHPEALEMTGEGPAVRGEILATDASEELLAAARAAGFAISSRERIEGLDLAVVVLAVPRGWSLEKAMRRLERLAPAGIFAPNYLHQRSGRGGAGGGMLAGGGAGGATIGIVDGGVASHPSLGVIEQKGFASGAPTPSAHGTAVASLAVGRPPVRGAAPGAPLLVADVYGRDPKGGNALAIARALGLMAQRRMKVVAMSLVGPPNPLLARAVALLRAQGIAIVAPVGNDGPAAPPAYPASYPGVISVTAVDRRNRPLLEAGRALHVDFAAPGADMAAASPDGGTRPVRGTSYAVPLVAGLLTRMSAEQLAVQARPLKGAAHGIVCADCRTAVAQR